MKKQILLPILLIIFSATTCFGQYTTSVIGLGWPNTTIRIDTTPATVTLTLKGESTRWLAIGFGTSATTMASCTDMFIWNDTTDRDYTTNTLVNGGHNMPTADADQSWTIVSDTVASGIRTVVASRALVSAGDYSFLNDFSVLHILFAQGDTTTLAYHGTNVHTGASLTRAYWGGGLALEDFSLNTASIYPNPSSGMLTVKTKTGLDKITIYSQTGDLVKTIPVQGQKEDNEINVSGLATGIYIFELQNGTEKAWKKVVVE
jgi:hypothetical protein